jgi:D-glycero-alpha-D-manno-heptose-7-phosphate kinase
MIVTGTPLRVTLGGGGTDLPSYYRAHGGFVFAMGIDRYMYLMVNRPALDPRVRVRHGRQEVVSRTSELEHELARVALESHGIEDRIEVASLADLPGGTGLGSSGAYLVGLLAALHRLEGGGASPQTLAEEACALEMDVLGRAVGKQDPYMAAFGGLTVLEIDRAGEVTPRPVASTAETVAALVRNTNLYYTGVRRSAEAVLRDQNQALLAGGAQGASGGSGGAAVVAESLHRIRDLGERILSAIEAGDVDAWGQLLHEHWQHKKRLSRRISLGAVDELYEHVRSEYGVLGGKIAGAGGGGFLVLYCPEGHERLERFMASRGMPRLHYGLAPGGVAVVAEHPLAGVAVAGPAQAVETVRVGVGGGK